MWVTRTKAHRGRHYGQRVYLQLALLVAAFGGLFLLTAMRPEAPKATAGHTDHLAVSELRVNAGPFRMPADHSAQYPYAQLIARVALKYGLPADLIAGVVWVESRFNPRCVSNRGAIGLMQLLPSTAIPLARKLGWKRFNLFDPQTSLELGTYFLKDRLREYKGQLSSALSYYNGGRWGIVSRGQYRNRGYVRDVLHHYRYYNNGGLTTPEEARAHHKRNNPRPRYLASGL